MENYELVFWVVVALLGLYAWTFGRRDQQRDDNQATREERSLVERIRDMDPQLGQFLPPGTTDEDLISSSQVSPEAMDIIGRYGEILDAVCNEGHSFPFPLSRLPYPKSVIRDALNEAQQVPVLGKFAESVDTGLVYLDFFVPDEEIPENFDAEKDLEKAFEVVRRHRGRH
jgi:hypothetical protein